MEDREAMKKLLTNCAMIVLTLVFVFKNPNNGTMYNVEDGKADVIIAFEQKEIVFCFPAISASPLNYNALMLMLKALGDMPTLKISK